MPYPYDADTLDALDRLDNFYNGDDYDASTNPGGFGHGGHRANFIPSLRDVAKVGDSVADATDVAQAAADAASNYATALQATSTTGITIGTSPPNKTFTTQAGKTFPIGDWVQISSGANVNNWMHGQVVSYSGTSLEVNVTQTNGSGTFNDWVIGLSAPRGPTGLTGATGPGGVAGIRYLFSNSTVSGDPGSGNLRINNASPASATALFISETDAAGANEATLLDTWDNGTSTVRGRVTIVQVNDATKIMSFDITGTRTDNGAWDTFTLSNGSGTLPTAGETIAVNFNYKGDFGNTGLTGNTGPAGGAISLNYVFSTTTTDADPGNGNLRLDNATQNSATKIRADLLDSIGADVTGVLDTFDDSTTTALPGSIRLYKTTDPTAYIIFSMLSGYASPAGYRNIPIQVLGSSTSNPFANGDAITLAFTRTGDAGGGAATAISFTPAGNIAATNVQTAIEELDAEKVSANNSVLTGTTDIQQALQLSGDISPTSLSADANDYNPTGLANASVLRLTSSVNVFITGLAGGSDGRIVVLQNIGSNVIALKNADTGSSAGNRFASGNDIFMLPNGGVVLQYDATTSRWKDIGRSTQVALVSGVNTVIKDHTGNVCIYLGAADNFYANTTHNFNSRDGATLFAAITSIKLGLLQTTASTNSTTGALTVAGGVGVAGAIFCASNVNGASFKIGSAAMEVATNYLQFRDPSGGIQLFIGNATDPTHYYWNDFHRWNNRSGSANYAVLDSTKLNINLATTSTNTTSGALVVAGGAGIAENLNVGGYISAAAASGFKLGSAVLAITSTDYHILRDPGNTNAIFLGNATDPKNYYQNTTHVFNTRTGAATIATLNATKLDLPQTTVSTSTTTGALTVAGGAGIAGALFVGGAGSIAGVLTVTGNLLLSSASVINWNSGAITITDSSNVLAFAGSSVTSYSFNKLIDLSASGAGQIKFPATQNPSSDVNTLDDYEEGTFTPTIGADTNGSHTYSDQTGSYTKIGRLVHVDVTISLSAKDAALSGLVNIKGLPFAPARTGQCTVNYFFSLAASVNWIGGYATNTGLQLTKTTAAGVAATQLVAADIGNSSGFFVSADYTI